jgi:hypothetical protein
MRTPLDVDTGALQVDGSLLQYAADVCQQLASVEAAGAGREMLAVTHDPIAGILAGLDVCFIMFSGMSPLV